jgi:hypothetical protein
MTTEDSIDINKKEFRVKLLEINIWAMTLILALVLEASSGTVVLITGTHRHVESTVWAAVLLMALVFGILLGTMVGILILHVQYKAPYRSLYVVLDNVFVAVPLYLAVRFISVSIGFGEASSAPLGFNDRLFRTGVALIAASYFFLLVRDFMVLPRNENVKLSGPPLLAVGAMHALGALLFISVAIVPSLVVSVAVTGSIGLGLFFAGVAARRFIEKLLGIDTPGQAPAPAIGD